MGVQFDREVVDAWVGLVRKLDPHEVASIWLQLAFFPDGPVDVPPDLHQVWETFSLWEQQHALYEFAPVVKKIAADQAHLLAQEARKREPL
jgi:hypothetical protein